MVRWMCGFVALGGAFACATTVAGQEEARPVPSVPSGLHVTLQDHMLDDLGAQGVFARFRFVVPEIAHGAGFAQVEADFAILCRDYALPALQDAAVQPDRIVISYADAPIAFGVSDPDSVQFFETFRVENDICIWEGF